MGMFSSWQPFKFVQNIQPFKNPLTTVTKIVTAPASIISGTDVTKMNLGDIGKTAGATVTGAVTGFVMGGPAGAVGGGVLGFASGAQNKGADWNKTLSNSAGMGLLGGTAGGIISQLFTPGIAAAKSGAGAVKSGASSLWSKVTGATKGWGGKIAAGGVVGLLASTLQGSKMPEIPDISGLDPSSLLGQEASAPATFAAAEQSAAGQPFAETATDTVPGFFAQNWLILAGLVGVLTLLFLSKKQVKTA